MLEQRMRRSSNDAGPWRVMGVLDYHGGAPVAHSFTRALSIQQDDIDALMSRGLLYTHGVFNPHGAIADFTEVIRLDPQHAEAYFRRAPVLALNKEALPSAIADVERALALVPGDPVLDALTDD